MTAVKAAYISSLFETHMRYGITTWYYQGDSRNGKDLVQQKRVIICFADIVPRERYLGGFKEPKIFKVVSLYNQEIILHAVNTTQLWHIDKHWHITHHCALPQHHCSLFGRNLHT